jgi:CBS domain-containing protein
MTNLKDIMSKNVFYATPETSLVEIAKLMVKANCGEIPLVKSKNEKVIVGVITDRDIVCRTLGVGKNPMNLFAKDCLSPQVISAHENSSVSECILLMKKNKIRRLPILDSRNELCGIVSLADLIKEGGPQEAVELLQEVTRPNEFPPVVH